MTQTLAGMVYEYHDVFCLNSGYGHFHHDGQHAMTGFGIGFADEFRIAMLEVCTMSRDNSGTLSKAFEEQEELCKYIKELMEAGTYLQYHSENNLEQTEFVKVQSGTVPLAGAEIAALHQLGHDINETILSLTGKYYRQLDSIQVRALDFSMVDFSARACEIKNLHEKPENRAIAVASAEILFNAAARLGREEDIPAAGTPWHGPLKRTMVKP